MFQRTKSLAFETAWKEHRDYLVRIAAKIVDAQNADDVVQEAAASAFAAFERFEGKSLVKTWFRRIVINEALAFIERERRIRQVEAGSLDDERFAHLAQRTAKRADAMDGVMKQMSADTYLRLLTPKQRAICWLRGEGFRFTEIGERVGMSADQVRYEFGKAAKRFHKTFTPELGTEPFRGFFNSLDVLDLTSTSRLVETRDLR